MSKRVLAVVLLGLVCSVAGAQVLETKTYAASGKPSNAVFTPDEKYVLVTVSGQARSGIDVFAVAPDGSLKRMAFQPLGSGQAAQGLLILPKYHLVAVGLSNTGLVLMPLEETLEGKATPRVVPQGDGAGSGYLVASPDESTIFVANEYGDGGNIGVVRLMEEKEGLKPVMVARIPTPRATPGVNISPDGSRVYTSGEVIRADLAAQLPGHDVPALGHDGCVQSNASRPMPGGVLYVIDATKVEAMTPDASQEMAHGVVRARVAGGCSPVREVVSADGKRLYVTLRGDNRIAVFDTGRLESDPKHALIETFTSGGDAPVGLALFDHDTKLLVADSDRFAGADKGKAAVIDVSAGASHGKVLQTITTGGFPRNIHVSADGRTLLLTVYMGGEVMVLRMK